MIVLRHHNIPPKILPPPLLLAYKRKLVSWAVFLSSYTYTYIDKIMIQIYL